MTKKRVEQPKSTGRQQPPAAQTGSAAKPALPPATSRPPCDPHCVDVTGKVPDDLRVDPDLTEGHPGYDESGVSEIIPPDRLAGQKAGEGKGRGG